MEQSRGPQRRERKDMRRNLERVLAAANELFTERGADVTMEEVARRAGVGVGTIYRRFPSKDQLFAAVSHAACTDAQNFLHRATETATDPISKLRALMYVQYKYNGQLAILIDMRPASQASTHDCAAREAEQLYETLHHLLQTVISEGQAQGKIRAGDPAAFATLCLELLNPRTLQNLQCVLSCSPEAATDQAIQFVLGGLGIQEEKATSSGD
jgi:AcrR family transcriptional regulator